MKRVRLMRLVNDIFKDSYLKGKDNIDWSKARVALINQFEQAVPDELPDDIYVLPDGGLARKPYGGNERVPLLPRQVSLLILAYGLSDGILRTRKELGKEFGVTPGALREAIIKARLKIRDNYESFGLSKPEF